MPAFTPVSFQKRVKRWYTKEKEEAVIGTTARGHSVSISRLEKSLSLEIRYPKVNSANNLYYAGGQRGFIEPEKIIAIKFSNVGTGQFVAIINHSADRSRLPTEFEFSDGTQFNANKEKFKIVYVYETDYLKNQAQYDTQYSLQFETFDDPMYFDPQANFDKLNSAVWENNPTYTDSTRVVKSENGGEGGPAFWYSAKDSYWTAEQVRLSPSPGISVGIHWGNDLRMTRTSIYVAETNLNTHFDSHDVLLDTQVNESGKILKFVFNKKYEKKIKAAFSNKLNKAASGVRWGYKIEFADIMPALGLLEKQLSNKQIKRWDKNDLVLGPIKKQGNTFVLKLTVHEANIYFDRIQAEKNGKYDASDKATHLAGDMLLINPDHIEKVGVKGNRVIIVITEGDALDRASYPAKTIVNHSVVSKWGGKLAQELDVVYLTKNEALNDPQYKDVLYGPEIGAQLKDFASSEFKLKSFDFKKKIQENLGVTTGAKELWMLTMIDTGTDEAELTEIDFSKPSGNQKTNVLRLTGLDVAKIYGVKRNGKEVFIVVDDSVDTAKLPTKPKGTAYSVVWLKKSEAESAEGFAKYKKVLDYESIAYVLSLEARSSGVPANKQIKRWDKKEIAVGPITKQGKKFTLKVKFQNKKLVFERFKITKSGKIDFDMANYLATDKLQINSDDVHQVGTKDNKIIVVLTKKGGRIPQPSITHVTNYSPPMWGQLRNQGVQPLEIVYLTEEEALNDPYYQGIFETEPVPHSTSSASSVAQAQLETRRDELLKLIAELEAKLTTGDRVVAQGSVPSEAQAVFGASFGTRDHAMHVFESLPSDWVEEHIEPTDDLESPDYKSEKRRKEINLGNSSVSFNVEKPESHLKGGWRLNYVAKGVRKNIFWYEKNIGLNDEDVSTDKNPLVDIVYVDGVVKLVLDKSIENAMPDVIGGEAKDKFFNTPKSVKKLGFEVVFADPATHVSPNNLVSSGASSVQVPVTQQTKLISDNHAYTIFEKLPPEWVDISHENTSDSNKRMELNSSGKYLALDVGGAVDWRITSSVMGQSSQMQMVYWIADKKGLFYINGKKRNRDQNPLLDISHKGNVVQLVFDSGIPAKDQALLNALNSPASGKTRGVKVVYADPAIYASTNRSEMRSSAAVQSDIDAVMGQMDKTNLQIESLAATIAATFDESLVVDEVELKEQAQTNLAELEVQLAKLNEELAEALAAEAANGFNARAELEKVENEITELEAEIRSWKAASTTPKLATAQSQGGVGARVLKEWDGNNLDLSNGYTLSKTGAGGKPAIWSNKGGARYDLPIPGVAVLQVLSDGKSKGGLDRFVVLFDPKLAPLITSQQTETINSQSGVLKIEVLWISKDELEQSESGEWQVTLPQTLKDYARGLPRHVIKFESETSSTPTSEVNSSHLGGVAGARILKKWNQRDAVVLGTIPGQNNLELSLTPHDNVGLGWFAGLKLTNTQGEAFGLKNTRSFLLEQVVQAGYVDHEATVYVVLDNSVPQSLRDDALPEISFPERNVSLHVKYVYQNEVEAHPDQYPMFEFEAKTLPVNGELVEWDGSLTPMGRTPTMGDFSISVYESVTGDPDSQSIMLNQDGADYLEHKIRRKDFVQGKYLQGQGPEGSIYFVIRNGVDGSSLPRLALSPKIPVFYFYKAQVENDPQFKDIFDFKTSATVTTSEVAPVHLLGEVGSSVLQSQLAELYKRRDKLIELIAIEEKISTPSVISAQAGIPPASVSDLQPLDSQAELPSAGLENKLGKFEVNDDKYDLIHTQDEIRLHRQTLQGWDQVGGTIPVVGKLQFSEIVEWLKNDGQKDRTLFISDEAGVLKKIKIDLVSGLTVDYEQDLDSGEKPILVKHAILNHGTLPAEGENIFVVEVKNVDPDLWGKLIPIKYDSQTGQYGKYGTLTISDNSESGKWDLVLRYSQPHLMTFYHNSDGSTVRGYSFWAYFHEDRTPPPSVPGMVTQFKTFKSQRKVYFQTDHAGKPNEFVFDFDGWNYWDLSRAEIAEELAEIRAMLSTPTQKPADSVKIVASTPVIPAQARNQPVSASQTELEVLKNRRARLIDWLNFTNAALIAGIEGIAAQIVVLVEQWLEIDKRLPFDFAQGKQTGGQKGGELTKMRVKTWNGSETEVVGTKGTKFFISKATPDGVILSAVQGNPQFGGSLVIDKMIVPSSAVLQVQFVNTRPQHLENKIFVVLSDTEYKKKFGSFDSRNDSWAVTIGSAVYAVQYIFESEVLNLPENYPVRFDLEPVSEEVLYPIKKHDFSDGKMLILRDGNEAGYDDVSLHWDSGLGSFEFTAEHEFPSGSRSRPEEVSFSGFAGSEDLVAAKLIGTKMYFVVADHVDVSALPQKSPKNMYQFEWIHQKDAESEEGFQKYEKFFKYLPAVKLISNAWFQDSGNISLPVGTYKNQNGESVRVSFEKTTDGLEVKEWIPGSYEGRRDIGPKSEDFITGGVDARDPKLFKNIMVVKAGVDMDALKNTLAGKAGAVIYLTEEEAIARYEEFKTILKYEKLVSNASAVKLIPNTWFQDDYPIQDDMGWSDFSSPVKEVRVRKQHEVGLLSLYIGLVDGNSTNFMITEQDVKKFITWGVDATAGRVVFVVEDGAPLKDYIISPTISNFTKGVLSVEIIHKSDAIKRHEEFKDILKYESAIRFVPSRFVSGKLMLAEFLAQSGGRANLTQVHLVAEGNVLKGEFTVPSKSSRPTVSYELGEKPEDFVAFGFQMEGKKFVLVVKDGVDIQALKKKAPSTGVVVYLTEQEASDRYEEFKDVLRYDAPILFNPKSKMESLELNNWINVSNLPGQTEMIHVDTPSNADEPRFILKEDGNRFEFHQGILTIKSLIETRSVHITTTNGHVDIPALSALVDIKPDLSSKITTLVFNKKYEAEVSKAFADELVSAPAGNDWGYQVEFVSLATPEAASESAISEDIRTGEKVGVTISNSELVIGHKEISSPIYNMWIKSDKTIEIKMGIGGTDQPTSFQLPENTVAVDWAYSDPLGKLLIAVITQEGLSHGVQLVQFKNDQFSLAGSKWLSDQPITAYASFGDAKKRIDFAGNNHWKLKLSDGKTVLLEPSQNGFKLLAISPTDQSADLVSLQPLFPGQAVPALFNPKSFLNSLPAPWTSDGNTIKYFNLTNQGMSAFVETNNPTSGLWGIHTKNGLVVYGSAGDTTSVTIETGQGKRRLDYKTLMDVKLDAVKNEFVFVFDDLVKDEITGLLKGEMHKESNGSRWGYRFDFITPPTSEAPGKLFDSQAFFDSLQAPDWRIDSSRSFDMETKKGVFKKFKGEIFGPFSNFINDNGVRHWSISQIDANNKGISVSVNPEWNRTHFYDPYAKGADQNNDINAIDVLLDVQIDKTSRTLVFKFNKKYEDNIKGFFPGRLFQAADDSYWGYRFEFVSTTTDDRLSTDDKEKQTLTQKREELGQKIDALKAEAERFNSPEEQARRMAAEKQALLAEIQAKIVQAQTDIQALQAQVVVKDILGTEQVPNSATIESPSGGFFELQWIDQDHALLGSLDGKLTLVKVMRDQNQEVVNIEKKEFVTNFQSRQTVDAIRKIDDEHLVALTDNEITILKIIRINDEITELRKIDQKPYWAKGSLQEALHVLDANHVLVGARENGSLYIYKIENSLLGLGPKKLKLLTDSYIQMGDDASRFGDVEAILPAGPNQLLVMGYKKMAIIRVTPASATTDPTIQKVPDLEVSYPGYVYSESAWIDKDTLIVSGLTGGGSSNSYRTEMYHAERNELGEITGLTSIINKRTNDYVGAIYSLQNGFFIAGYKKTSLNKVVTQSDGTVTFESRPSQPSVSFDTSLAVTLKVNDNLVLVATGNPKGELKLIRILQETGLSLDAEAKITQLEAELLALQEQAEQLNKKLDGKTSPDDGALPSRRIKPWDWSRENFVDPAKERWTGVKAGNGLQIHYVGTNSIMALDVSAENVLQIRFENQDGDVNSKTIRFYVALKKGVDKNGLPQVFNNIPVVYLTEDEILADYEKWKNVGFQFEPIEAPQALDPVLDSVLPGFFSLPGEEEVSVHPAVGVKTHAKQYAYGADFIKANFREYEDGTSNLEGSWTVQVNSAAGNKLYAWYDSSRGFYVQEHGISLSNVVLLQELVVNKRVEWDEVNRQLVFALPKVLEAGFIQQSIKLNQPANGGIGWRIEFDEKLNPQGVNPAHLMINVSRSEAREADAVMQRSEKRDGITVEEKIVAVQATGNIFGVEAIKRAAQSVMTFLLENYPQFFDDEKRGMDSAALLNDERLLQDRITVARVYNQLPSFDSPELEFLADYLARNPKVQLIVSASADRSEGMAFVNKLIQQSKDLRVKLGVQDSKFNVVWKQESEVLDQLKMSSAGRSLLFSDKGHGDVLSLTETLAIQNDQTGEAEVLAGLAAGLKELLSPRKHQGWVKASSLLEYVGLLAKVTKAFAQSA